MSRQFAAAGIAIAAVVGITTSYVTFQPELQRIKEQRDGVFPDQHVPDAKDNETVISQAIMSDLREAREEARKTQFAWGIRQWLFGKPDDNTMTGAERRKAAAAAAAAREVQQAAQAQQAPKDQKDEKVG